MLRFRDFPLELNPLNDMKRNRKHASTSNPRKLGVRYSPKNGGKKTGNNIYRGGKVF